jgi:hypothetical protein
MLDIASALEALMSLEEDMKINHAYHRVMEARMARDTAFPSGVGEPDMALDDDAFNAWEEKVMAPYEALDNVLSKALGHLTEVLAQVLNRPVPDESEVNT